MARIVILGGTGFVGHHTVAAAIAAGHQVTAVVRSPAKAHHMTEQGADVILGSALHADEWITQAAGADILVDLAQPSLPTRLTVVATRDIARKRLAMTHAICTALLTLPRGERPVLVTASGTDDLLPDSTGVITDVSPLRGRPRGFAHIGIPVRRTVTSFVDNFGLSAAFVYFGNVVYGPGKGFTDSLVTGLRSGRGRVIGRGENVLPLTSVYDAAAAVAYLAGRQRAELDGGFLAVPPSSTTQRSFLDMTADMLGVDRPAPVPPLIAAAVAGRVNADVMTLDATAVPQRLTALGFTFAHTDLRKGIGRTLADIQARAAASATPRGTMETRL